MLYPVSSFNFSGFLWIEGKMNSEAQVSLCYLFDFSDLRSNGECEKILLLDGTEAP